MRSQAERWWQLAGAIPKLVRSNGAYPSARELSRVIRLDRFWTLRYLQRMREDGLVEVVGRGPEAGWTLTSEGARWREVEMPRVTVDGPRRKIRLDWRALRAWRRVQRLRALRAGAVVFDAGSRAVGEFEVFES